MNKKILPSTLTVCMSVATAFAAVPVASPVLTAKPTIAEICTNCHKAEPNLLRGNFGSVAFKSKTIQMNIDDSVELVTFDEDDIKVIDFEGKTGDGELLKNHLIKEGQYIEIEYTEKDGVKTAVKLIESPPAMIPQEMLITTADVEKLVSMGPAKGRYFLFDSRPLPSFQEGYIPTAVNLPFSAFDKLAEKLLPKDKNALIVFYCAGPFCDMSPSSADKAKKLGYTNIKLYKDGMPGWQEKNFGVISTKSLKEAWFDKDIPTVLLDVRTAKDAGKGFIKGAVVFSAKQVVKLAKGLGGNKNAPIIVYDKNGGKDATVVASTLVKAGFKKVLVLDGGFAAWQTAKYDVTNGNLATRATYTPKPRKGEIDLAEFKKDAAVLPANVMIIDVRQSDEGKAGMLKNAKLIPAEDLRSHTAEIPKDKLIVTYCATGVRAEMAYHALKNLGYTNVKFVNAKIEFEKNGNYAIFKN